MGGIKRENNLTSTALNTQDHAPAALRTAMGDVMKFEILLNEKARVWVFHDKALPGRLAWVEFDPATGTLDLIPHDMRDGILYTDVPPALHMRVRSSDMVYFYLTDGDKVTGFQKIPLNIRRAHAE